jgi:hypothetical protein
MLSEKAQIGKRVRIRADHHSKALRGMIGLHEIAATDGLAG